MTAWSGRPAGTDCVGAACPSKGVEFIAGFEGFSSRLYNDSGGHATIGFGHLVHRGRIDGSEPAEFQAGITRGRGLELLHADAAAATGAVDRNVVGWLRQHQLDALISFAFNCGGGAFARSGLLDAVNTNRYAAVPVELARWTRSGGRVLPGLIRRRTAEARLFTAGHYTS